MTQFKISIINYGSFPSIGTEVCELFMNYGIRSMQNIKNVTGKKSKTEPGSKA
jgi:hypothetical protein